MTQLTIDGLRLASPNLHESWPVRARRRRRERALVARALAGIHAPDPPWCVTLTRTAPRLMDSDNLLGSFKSVRDEIADWLGTDDGPGGPVTWIVVQRTGATPCVTIRIAHVEL